MSKLIDGKFVRDIKKDELTKKVKALKTKLTLVDISVGDDAATKVYVKQKEKMALEIGYEFLNIHYDSTTNEELIKKIHELNNDKKITGIIVQLPLPDYLDKDLIINTIEPLKDVDGLTRANIVKLIKKEEGLAPCTPKGIVSLLDFYKIDICSHVVIVGRSELVGLPLFYMLLNRNATVTICHSKTMNLSKYTKKADILIVAVGKKWLVTKDMVRNGSVVIDVGITKQLD